RPSSLTMPMLIGSRWNGASMNSVSMKYRVRPMRVTSSTGTSEAGHEERLVILHAVLLTVADEPEHQPVDVTAHLGGMADHHHVEVLTRRAGGDPSGLPSGLVGAGPVLDHRDEGEPARHAHTADPGQLRRDGVVVEGLVVRRGFGLARRAPLDLVARGQAVPLEEGLDDAVGRGLPPTTRLRALFGDE